MSYIYRYIDLEKEEVVYIGKVTKHRDFGYEPLRNRHEQHCREEWYKQNKENLVMQYIEFDNQCDVDIIETWLINFYDTGQLLNKAKVSWGRSTMDLWPIVSGKWRTYGKGSGMNNEKVTEMVGEFVRNLYRQTEGYTIHIESGLQFLCEDIKKVHGEWVKTQKLSRCDEQGLFLRSRQKGDDLK